jgi:hypothetical protein
VKIPVLQGVIARRILVNYQVDAEVLERLLPAPFRPKLIRGVGMAGVCLIGLHQVKPKAVSGNLGFSSENAAHRIAVEWQDGNELREGVFILRRDSSSRLNTLVGGRFFPGFHHYATIHVHDQGHKVAVDLASDDRSVQVNVKGHVATELPSTSIFQSLQEVSEFFEGGAVGYSVTPTPGHYDGLELRTFGWKVEPLGIEQIKSSFFADETKFPVGSIRFDCALIMRNIQHEWHSLASLCAPAAV